jgi:hypothetical protein
LQTIAACRAGKDVYCEKPISHTVREGRAMVEAVRRYGRVCTGGSQRVRGDHGREADYVANGHIGEVIEVRVGSFGPPRPAYELAAQPVPAGLDWDLWVGPAPWRPCHEKLLLSHTWHQTEEFGNGSSGNWGSHRLGGVLYALELDATGPEEVVPVRDERGRVVEVLFRFANGQRIYHARGEEVVYVGTKGRVTNRQSKSLPEQADSPLRQYSTGCHSDLLPDFLNGVRTRERPFQDIEYAHRTATMCHLSNIAYALGRPLRWDVVAEEFVGDADANRLLGLAYREPWRL